MKPYLNNVSGKSKADIITLDGGLNTCYDKTFIRDNQLPFMWNVAPIKAPTLSTRSNRTSLAWFMEDTTNYATNPIIAMFVSSSKKLYTIEDKRTVDEPNAASFVYRYEIEQNNNLKRTYIGQIEYAKRYSIDECRDATNVYIIISTKQKRYQFQEGMDDSVQEMEDEYAGIVCAHKNRLFVAKGTTITFSKLSEYDDFTIVEVNSDEDIQALKDLETAEEKEQERARQIAKYDASAGYIHLRNAKGQIVAMKSYDGKLIVFCERSWHIIYGTSPYSEVDQFSAVDMEDGIGCISDTTVAICDRKLYWMDSDLSIYQYNGSYINTISEPYGNDNYAQYGGIKDIGIRATKLDKIIMSSYDNYVYIAVTLDPTAGAKNDTIIVYDTRNRVWWAEDGAFSSLVKWDTDSTTPFYNRTDYLIGARYNGDLLIMNCLQDTGEDVLFNVESRHCDSVKIQYKFETKTWNLGQIKHKKTLTNIWWQASADAKVAVCDYWGEHNSWDPTIDINKDYLVLGKIEPNIMRHNVQEPKSWLHEGKERQRFIVPRMYMQKINAFSIRIEGEGQGHFYMLEKEWRIR